MKRDEVFCIRDRVQWIGATFLALLFAAGLADPVTELRVTAVVISSVAAVAAIRLTRVRICRTDKHYTVVNLFRTYHVRCDEVAGVEIRRYRAIPGLPWARVMLRDGASIPAQVLPGRLDHPKFAAFLRDVDRANEAVQPRAVPVTRTRGVSSRPVTTFARGAVIVVWLAVSLVALFLSPGGTKAAVGAVSIVGFLVIVRLQHRTRRDDDDRRTSTRAGS